MKENIFWDKKTSLSDIKKILKDEKSKRFVEISALLLSRTNDPKEVFSKYLNIVLFCKNWNAIKKRMRQNEWSSKRIDFWDEVYRVALSNIDKDKIRTRKTKKKAQDVDIQEIGQILKQARKDIGWTQREASKKTGISQQTISFIERGNVNVSFKTLKKIAKFYNLKITLISEEKTEISYPDYI